MAQLNSGLHEAIDRLAQNTGQRCPPVVPAAQASAVNAISMSAALIRPAALQTAAMDVIASLAEDQPRGILARFMAAGNGMPDKLQMLRLRKVSGLAKRCAMARAMSTAAAAAPPVEVT